MNNRAYNKYNQHERLVNFVKELTPEKIVGLKKIISNVDDYVGYYTLLNGNQSFYISVDFISKEALDFRKKLNISLFKQLFFKLKNNEEIKDFLKTELEKFPK